MTSQSYRDVAYPQETAQDVVVLLAIEHADLDTPIRLATAGGTLAADGETYEFVALGETWICAGFEIDLPGSSDREPEAKITVGNVDQRIGAVLDAIVTPAVCTIWAVLEGQPDEIVGGPHRHLRLIDVSGDAMSIEGTLTRASLTTEPWPTDRISAGRFLAAMRAITR